MSKGDKRKHPRVKTNNEIAYVILDDRDNEIDEGLGKIVNVSLGGILIETIKPIGLQNILLTTTGIDDERINMKGDVTHCRMEDSKTFRTGVQFLETKENIELFVTTY